MEAVIAALAALVTKQGDQIVDLSKALAIAHEHHGAQAAVVIPPAPTHAYDSDRKLWLTEEEEDAEYAEDPNGIRNSKLYHDILAEVGLAPTIEAVPPGS